MNSPTAITQKISNFCRLTGVEVPILLAPMAGACPVGLSVEVANAGGMGGCGALLMQPDAILKWVEEFKLQAGKNPLQINLWIPGHSPKRNISEEDAMCSYLSTLGPSVQRDAGSSTPPDFEKQFEAILEAKPKVISSIMGVFSLLQIKQLKDAGILYSATVTTIEEAQIAEEAGADMIVAQGSEAGGHRGSFDPEDGLRKSVGLFSLLPQIVDNVDLPVIATGGIVDARTAYACFVLGASAVQIGTGFLRSPEAGISSSWAQAIGQTNPEDTIVTRAFSGRYGRSQANKFALALESDETPNPAPYPVQRGLTAKLRAQATKDNNIDAMQAWMGQSASLAKQENAAKILADIWNEIQADYLSA